MCSTLNMCCHDVYKDMLCNADLNATYALETGLKMERKERPGRTMRVWRC
jgi:hypothetical protein